MKAIKTRHGISQLIAIAAAASLLGCTGGTGPSGAPPLERWAVFPVQLIALPFMLLRPFAPLIQAGMQAGIQMAPYALLFCRNEAGPSEFMLAAVREEVEDRAALLPQIEARLAEDGRVEMIVAVDLNELGGAERVQKLLAAMEKNGLRCRWTVVDASDLISCGPFLDRLRDALLENEVTLYATGSLSTAVADRFGDEFVGRAWGDTVSKSWLEAFGAGAGRPRGEL